MISEAIRKIPLQGCIYLGMCRWQSWFGKIELVLQRGVKAPIWGWAEPGETVRVKGSWKHRGVCAKADMKCKCMRVFRKESRH